jgi:predicted metal-dependent phosphotriesterase family hydrolase
MMSSKTRFGSLAVWAVVWSFAQAAHAQQPVDDPALKGAIDVHSHLDPDGFGPGRNGRALDVLDMAKMAKEAGMRGFVIKMHYDQSADDAYYARKLYPGIEIFGGIGTNFATGGLNPAAIRQMADVKGGWGRIVWMPTWDAKHYVEHNGNDRPYITVAKNGQLTPDAKALIAAVAEVNGKTRGSRGTMVLATGHNAPDEVLLMVKEARGLGLQVIVTHPLLESVGMSLEQMQQAADMGAYLEFVTAFTREEKTIREHVEAIRKIGPEHCIVSSDKGQGRGEEGHDGPIVTHVQGLAEAAQILRKNGFSEAELDLLFKSNPARLLGLPVL